MLNVSRGGLDVVAGHAAARRGQVDRLPRLHRHGPHRPQGPQAAEAGRGARQLTQASSCRLAARDRHQPGGRPMRRIIEEDRELLERLAK